MGKLRDLHNKLNKLTERELEYMLLRVIKQNEELFIDANTGQLMAGKDNNDNPIEPPYASALYAAFKLTLNPAGVVDLKLTGDFHESFVLRTNQFPLLIGATDPKTEDLRNKYGDDIFGITEQGLAEINQGYLKEQIQNQYRNLLRV